MDNKHEAAKVNSPMKLNAQYFETNKTDSSIGYKIVCVIKLRRDL
jgi:hypothetical protein